MIRQWLSVILVISALVFACLGCSGHKSDRSEAEDDQTQDDGGAQPVLIPIGTGGEDSDPEDSSLPDVSIVNIAGVDYALIQPRQFTAVPRPFMVVTAKDDDLHYVAHDVQTNIPGLGLSDYFIAVTVTDDAAVNPDIAARICSYSWPKISTAAWPVFMMSWTDSAMHVSFQETGQGSVAEPAGTFSFPVGEERPGGACSLFP